MTGEDILFTVFALATCLSAVAVVVSQTVVRMAFWLVISLGSAAGLFFLADADFVGAAQLLIYVGGTLVLLVFGVMLTASGPYLKIATSPGETVLAGLIGLLFLFVVFASIGGVEWPAPPETVGAEQRSGGAVVGETLRPLGLSLLGLRPDLDLEDDAEHAQRQEGKSEDEDKVTKLSTGYLLPFEIVSVHLLVVLIGAAYLARAKRRADVTADSTSP